jgi:hypothetical protein
MEIFNRVKWCDLFGRGHGVRTWIFTTIINIFFYAEAANLANDQQAMEWLN